MTSALASAARLRSSPPSAPSAPRHRESLPRGSRPARPVRLAVKPTSPCRSWASRTAALCALPP